MAEILLERVTKRYGAIVAVDELELGVQDHELLVLVGPSGCGKTTTLRLIAGLETVTSGRILLGGRPAHDLAPQHRHVAMVFQSGALYPHLNVYHNLAFGLRLQRTARAEIDRRVRRAAASLGIETLLLRRPGALSGGERQRVAIGRAIVGEPDAFLLDEPLSHLDAPLRAALRRELVQLQQRLQATMLYVTHDQLEALTLGHRIAVMNAGRVQQVGSPAAVYQRPANRFVAEFIGSPPMNFLDGVLAARDGAVCIEFPGFTLPVPSDRAAVCAGRLGSRLPLGLRPQAVTAAPHSGARSTALPPATVTLVQPLGAETYVDVQCRGCEFTARAGTGAVLQRGDVVDVTVDMRECHLFDPATGQTLAE